MSITGTTTSVSTTTAAHRPTLIERAQTKLIAIQQMIMEESIAEGKLDSELDQPSPLFIHFDMAGVRQITERV